MYLCLYPDRYNARVPVWTPRACAPANRLPSPWTHRRPVRRCWRPVSPTRQVKLNTIHFVKRIWLGRAGCSLCIKFMSKKTLREKQRNSSYKVESAKVPCLINHFLNKKYILTESLLIFSKWSYCCTKVSERRSCVNLQCKAFFDEHIYEYLL